MQMNISDDIVKRAVKAANWYFGKDTQQAQIEGILADFCYRIEQNRTKEEAELNAKIAATKKIIARYKSSLALSMNIRVDEIPKCRVWLTDGTDRIVYGLVNLGELGYMAFSDPAHKKPAPIIPGLMHTWTEAK